MVLLVVPLFSCVQSEPDTYAAAREYFYGVDGRPGHLVSTWTGTYRSERLVLARAGYGLGEEWQYLDEDLDVRDLGRHEYFFRYIIRFKSSKTNTVSIREESYYSIGDELWEPVPLTTKTYTISTEGMAESAPDVKALWRCDFDGYLEDREIECIRRVQTQQ
jgi:hypothetical protein